MSLVFRPYDATPTRPKMSCGDRLAFTTKFALTGGTIWFFFKNVLMAQYSDPISLVSSEDVAREPIKGVKILVPTVVKPTLTITACCMAFESTKCLYYRYKNEPTDNIIWGSITGAFAGAATYSLLTQKWRTGPGVFWAFITINYIFEKARQLKQNPALPPNIAVREDRSYVEKLKLMKD